MADESRCPDCGGRVEDHNAVNRVPDGIIAHSGYMGACWKSLNTPFVDLVREYLLGLTRTAPTRHNQEERGGQGEGEGSDRCTEAVGGPTIMPAEQRPLCPDCGGRVEDHNSVNRVPQGLIAHSEQGGACWKSLNTPFVDLVREHLLGLKGTAQARHSQQGRGGRC